MTKKWLSYKDIKPIITNLTSKVKIKDLIVHHIKKYDDVNYLVGKIIEACQISELYVKTFMEHLKIDKKSLAIKGIGDLIAHLGNKKFFNSQEIELLRKSVKVRNYISHHFYLEYKDKKIFSIVEIEKTLNSILYIINLGSIIVKNKLTKIN